MVSVELYDSFALSTLHYALRLRAVTFFSILYITAWWYGSHYLRLISLCQTMTVSVPIQEDNNRKLTHFSAQWWSSDGGT